MVLPVSKPEAIYNWLKNQSERRPYQRSAVAEKKEETKKPPAEGHTVDEYA